MADSMKHHAAALLLLFAVLLLVPAPASAGCECGDEEAKRDKPAALRLKYAAIAAILAASSLGIASPVLGARFAALRPEGDAFFVIKAFAAGVILATAMIHILPDAMEKLASPCLPETPWRKFPFSGFVAMVAALATMVVDNVASIYYRRVHFGKAQPVADSGDVEEEQAHAGHVHVHTHATHGHAHGALESSPEEESLRHRVVSQVLELGIVIHSVIIGIALGTSESPSTIRPLVGALSFHQFFEGIGLGGCLLQARFKVKAVITMAIFFCLTTPVGIAIGIGIASSYDENSTKALIVEGILDSASSGILIYTSLVDLLAEDFSNSRMQTSGRLQLMSYTSLFLGAGAMSLIGKWA